MTTLPEVRFTSKRQLVWVRAYRDSFGNTDVEALAAWEDHRAIPAKVLPTVAALARAAGERWGQAPGEAARRLLTYLGVLRDIGAMTVNQQVGWLRVLAACPYDTAATELALRLSAQGHGQDGDLAGWVALPGATGPLGWCAGLDPQEAAGRSKSDLAVLAALRGWVLLDVQA